MSEPAAKRTESANAADGAIPLPTFEALPGPNEIVAVIAGGAEGKEVSVVTGDRILTADCSSSKIKEVVDTAASAGASGQDPYAAWESNKRASKLKSVAIGDVQSIDWRSDDLDEFKLHHRNGAKVTRRTMLASDTNDAVPQFIGAVTAIRTGNKPETAKQSVRELTAMEASLAPMLATLVVAAVGGFAIFLSMSDPAEIEDAGSGRRGRQGRAIAGIANSIGPMWVSIIVAVILAGCIWYWFDKVKNRPNRHTIEF